MITDTVLHKCALCGVAVAGGQHSAHLIDALLKDHHAVCPKRPVAVADYVRWDGNGLAAGLWATGMVVEVVNHLVWVTVDAVSTCWNPQCQRSDGAYPFGASGIRRIPRPGAGEVQHRMTTTAKAVCNPMQTHLLGKQAAVNRIAAQRLIVYEPDPDCPCGIFYTLVDGTVAEHRFPPAARGGRHDPTECPCGQEHPPGRPAPFSDTQLYYLAKWMENRLAVEGGAAPPNPMTPEQIAIGRAAWQAQYGAQRSAELRGKVEARTAAKANPVRVEVQDVE